MHHPVDRASRLNSKCLLPSCRDDSAAVETCPQCGEDRLHGAVGHARSNLICYTLSDYTRRLFASPPLARALRPEARRKVADGMVADIYQSHAWRTLMEGARWPSSSALCSCLRLASVLPEEHPSCQAVARSHATIGLGGTCPYTPGHTVSARSTIDSALC